MKKNLFSILFCVGIMTSCFSVIGMSRYDSLREVVSGGQSPNSNFRVANSIEGCTCNCSKQATVILAGVLATGVLCFFAWLVTENSSKYTIENFIGNVSVG